MKKESAGIAQNEFHYVKTPFFSSWSLANMDVSRFQIGATVAKKKTQRFALAWSRSKFVDVEKCARSSDKNFGVHLVEFSLLDCSGFFLKIVPKCCINKLNTSNIYAFRYRPNNYLCIHCIQCIHLVTFRITTIIIVTIWKLTKCLPTWDQQTMSKYILIN